MPSALEFITMQVETLFTHDSTGRMLRVNEPGGANAPRFFLGRTGEGNIWRFRHDLPQELVDALEALCAAEPVPADLHEAPVHVGELERLLESASGIRRRWSGPAYRFPSDMERCSDVVTITSANEALLRPGFSEWLPEVAFRQPCVAVLEGGVAVSLCCSARVSPQAHEAGVETLEGYRGRGYAGRVVAAWAAAVRQLGRIPLYSTSWDNSASQRVAAKLGLIAYGADLHFT